MSNDSNLFPEEKHLPSEILEKAILSGKEYGWKRSDFKEVIDTAVEKGLSVVGGQVQFKFSDGTCELYWQKYDPSCRKENEGWDEYCQRTKRECFEKFELIPNNEKLVDEGIRSFSFLSKKAKDGVRIEDHLIFIIYFDDAGSQKAEREYRK